MNSYDTINDIPEDECVGGLYIFNTLIDNQLLVKIGKTSRNFKERLKEHPASFNIKCIECNSDKERIMLLFLKLRTSIRPVKGNEFFELKHRSYLEKVVLYFALISEKELIYGDTVDYLNRFLMDINAMTDKCFSSLMKEESLLSYVIRKVNEEKKNNI